MSGEELIDWLEALAKKQRHERGCAFYLGTPDPQIAQCIAALRAHPLPEQPQEGDAAAEIASLKLRLESAEEELDRFRRPNDRNLSTRDPISPLPGFSPRHLLGMALHFREWCHAPLWGRPQEAELAARQVETAYLLLQEQEKQNG